MRSRYVIRVIAAAARRCLPALVCLCLCPGIALAAGGPLAGVNIVNPQWRSAKERAVTIAQLKQYGIAAIRVPWTAPHAAARSFIVQASEAGASVLLFISLNDPRSMRSGAVRRPGHDQTWDMFGLTDIDPARFKTNFSADLASLEAEGIRLAGIEVGNEINWTPFNGDFPIPARGRILGSGDLKNSREGLQIARGYDRYIEILKAVKAVRDASRLNKSTPVISAGLANLGQAKDWLRHKKFDVVSPHATLRYLRARGLDALVDVYGVHFYPRPGEAWSEQKGAWQNALRECAPAARGKPCWLTEWGFANTQSGCGVDDAPRAENIGRTERFLTSLLGSGRLARAFYFNWNRQVSKNRTSRFGLLRCGHLMEGGKAFLDTAGAFP